MGLVPLENITGFSNSSNNLTAVATTNGNYYLDENLAIQLSHSNGEYLIAYLEAPAVLAGMRGAIIQADDVKIIGHDTLREFLENKQPGDSVKFITENEKETKEYDIILGEHPEDSSRAYVGVGHSVASRQGFVQKVLVKFMDFKESSTLYKPTWDGKFVYFIYHLFWWIMIINLLVALFNMMPLGMLDGGQFFYLAMLGIFKSEKTAKVLSKIAGYVILFSFIVMMFLWFVRIM